MRRTFVVVALVLGSGLLLAAPAAAQRDPFQPAAGQGGAIEAPPGSGTQEEPAQVAPPPTDPLANTGAEIEPWLALAYGLIAAGAGAVTIGRVARPTPAK